MRAKNRLLAASTNLPFAYDLWINRQERMSDVLRASSETIAGWRFLPKFHLLLYGVDGTEADIRATVRSVENQAYSNWTLDRSRSSALRERIRSGESDYLIPIRVGNRLSPAALYRFAEALQTHAEASILYGDQDEYGESGCRRRPWFKPAWNEELFLAQDYISSAVALKTGLVRSIDASDIEDLIIEATSRRDVRVVHVPHILSHVRPSVTEAALKEREKRLSKRISTEGGRCYPGPFETTRIQWPLPSGLPLVTIIVPTKDKLNLLKPCVDSVLACTTYENFEILIVDNQSVETTTKDYLAEISRHPQVRVIAYPHPYNYSAINNFAVSQAQGLYLCLLNNDTEVVEENWLTEMMRYAARAGVGAVGAKLLYDDGSIQHAGVVVGIGQAAGHAHRFLPKGHAGYFALPHATHYVSAVTAACLVVEKYKFLTVGGLDEEHFAVAFNDVDFCLKLKAAGWQNVYVPHAVLIHHESKSRGSDVAPENIERYSRELRFLQERWGTTQYQDPLHNPNLDRSSETFAFRF